MTSTRDSVTIIVADVGFDIGTNPVLSSTLQAAVLSAFTQSAVDVTQITRVCGLCGRQHGKPRLEPGGVFWSTSHDRKNFVMALASHEVGIDIVPSRRYMPHNFLSANELEVLNVCQPDNRESIIALLWSLKEAYLKLRAKASHVSPAGLDYANHIALIGNWAGDDYSSAVHFEAEDCSFTICPFDSKHDEVKICLAY